MANKESNFPTNQQPKLAPMEMGEMVAAMDELRNLNEIDHRSPGALAERIQYFFDWCVTNDMRPTVDLMALAVGVSRVSLWKWEQEGGSRGKIIGRAKQLLAALTEQWAVTGKINPTTAIFLQKNHFGYSDQYELTAGPIDKLAGLKSKEEIIKSLPAEISLPGNDPDIEALLEDLESTQEHEPVNT